MLLLLLSFYVHNGLLNCEENVTAKSSLVDRKNLLEVNDLLQDLEHKTRKLLVLLADDQPYDKRKETYNILKRVLSEKDQNNQKSKNLTKPALLYHPIARDRAPKSVIRLDAYVTSRPHFPPVFLKMIRSTYPGLQKSPSSLSEKVHTGSRSKIQQVTSTPLSTTRSSVTAPSSTIKTTTIGRIARGWFDEIAPYTNVRKKIKKVLRNLSQPSVLIPLNMTVPTSYRSSTWRYRTSQHFEDKKHGWLNANLSKSVSRPKQTPGDPYKAWTTTMTTAGDVLYGKVKVQTTPPSDQCYQELMQHLDEGYLVVFGLEMFRLIAVKEKRDVREVLAPMETIFKTSLESCGLLEVDNPFLTMFGSLATIVSKDDIDPLRTYSSMMFHTLLQRKTVLSPEVNSMIDQAGLSYSDEEGRRLLRSLTEFENYPYTNKSSFSICASLVEGILQPFQRPADSKSRQELLNSINNALRHNYPQLSGGVGTPTTLSLIGTTISKIGTQPRIKIKKKRRLKPGNYNENTRPNMQYLDYHQPSFIKAITTKSYRTIKNRPTNASLRSKQRPTNACLWNYPTKRIPKRKLVHHRHQKDNTRVSSKQVAPRP